MIRRVDDLTIAIIASFQVIVNRYSQNKFEIVAIMNRMTSKALILSVFGVVLRGYSASFSPFFRRVVYSTNTKRASHEALFVFVASSSGYVNIRCDNKDRHYDREHESKP